MWVHPACRLGRWAVCVASAVTVLLSCSWGNCVWFGFYLGAIFACYSGMHSWAGPWCSCRWAWCAAGCWATQDYLWPGSCCSWLLWQRYGRPVWSLWWTLPSAMRRYESGGDAPWARTRQRNGSTFCSTDGEYYITPWVIVSRSGLVEEDFEVLHHYDVHLSSSLLMRMFSCWRAMLLWRPKLLICVTVTPAPVRAPTQLFILPKCIYNNLVL